MQAAVSVDKYTKMCEDAIELEAVSAVKRQGNLVYRAQLETLCGDLTALRGRGGYFNECALGGLEDLAPFVTEKYQTVTTFGLEPEQSAGLSPKTGCGASIGSARWERPWISAFSGRVRSGSDALQAYCIGVNDDAFRLYGRRQEGGDHRRGVCGCIHCLCADDP